MAPGGGDQPAFSIVTAGAPPLELVPADATPPRLEHATSIEGDRLAARAVGAPSAAFAAFLDGIQSSRVILNGANGVPVVHGTVAAVVRRRADRRLSVWPGSPLLSRAVYAPLAVLGDAGVAQLHAISTHVVDTLRSSDPADARHPHELLSLARNAVQGTREHLEARLAEAWCDAESAPLYVDGGISGAGRAGASPYAIGVVKSHRSLYALSGSLGVVTSLAEGERTTSFEPPSRNRAPVASWYLRLRDAHGRDPLFGLVRVEIARDSWSVQRADDVSRWILAERAPVSLPDPRWASMAYGIRDCEEFLRAITVADR